MRCIWSDFPHSNPSRRFGGAHAVPNQVGPFYDKNSRMIGSNVPKTCGRRRRACLGSRRRQRLVYDALFQRNAESSRIHRQLAGARRSATWHCGVAVVFQRLRTLGRRGRKRVCDSVWIARIRSIVPSSTQRPTGHVPPAGHGATVHEWRTRRRRRAISLAPTCQYGERETPAHANFVFKLFAGHALLGSVSHHRQRRAAHPANQHQAPE